MSSGGTQTWVPETIAHVYVGSPTSRSGQSSLVSHFAVHPTPPVLQYPTLLGHCVAELHGRSMSTHTFLPPPTGLQAKPAGHCVTLVHVCVQCDAVVVPMQYSRHGEPVVVSHPFLPV